MISTRLIVDVDFGIAELDRRLFGTFVEHLGRCVYTGIYEPGHPNADERGFRRDVMDLFRELGATLVRYPGGNFVSGYNWEDGVGPRNERPVRLDLAWGSTESNQFGTNEILDWCRHGYEQPHGVKFWCLGNEMDAPWQIGMKSADDYGQLAREAAKLMRLVDPGVLLATCGSSMHDIRTFGIWEDRVLSHCFDEIDFISLHHYFENPHQSAAEFLANIDRTESFIKEIVAVADAVAARQHSRKRIMLSFDEWNVWYKARGPANLRQPGWPEAPRLLEEVYNHEDALAVGGALIVMMNNADRVKTACLAQLVNVIGPIMTEPGGPAWRQTIFHPFSQAARHAHGRVLKPVIHSPSYRAETFPEVPYLCASVVHDDSTGRTAIFALNRHLSDEQEIEIELRGLGDQHLVESSQLHHTDMKAINTADAPETVAPRRNDAVRLEGQRLRARLKPASWNMFLTTNAQPR